MSNGTTAGILGPTTKVTAISGNLVTTTPSRFTVIRPELLPTMQVLEVISTEAIIAARKAQFLVYWQAADPPNAALYDVSNTEFDPIVIQHELSTFFELLLRDRVNQACRAVTLAFAIGSDLDAIASRYPYGVPRLDLNGDGVADEDDIAYRTRVWLSPSIFSLNGPGQGTYESYVFWALSTPMPTGELPLKHAAAFTRRATGNVIVVILPNTPMNTTWVRVPSNQNQWTLQPGIVVTPTKMQISVVYEYISAPDEARMGLTDYLSVLAPKAVNTDIKVNIWLFPGVDPDTLMGEIRDAITNLIQALRWLGADLTDLALKGALAQAGAYRTQVLTPNGDVTVGSDSVINVGTVTLTYMGMGE